MIYYGRIVFVCYVLVSCKGEGYKKSYKIQIINVLNEWVAQRIETKDIFRICCMLRLEDWSTSKNNCWHQLFQGWRRAIWKKWCCICFEWVKIIVYYEKGTLCVHFYTYLGVKLCCLQKPFFSMLTVTFFRPNIYPELFGGSFFICLTTLFLFSLFSFFLCRLGYFTGYFKHKHYIKIKNTSGSLMHKSNICYSMT